MARKLLPNTLWGNVQYLQPSNPPSSRKGGRPLADDRLALRGILFVLRTGLPWEDVLAEVFGLSGMTCDGDASGTEWRRKSELRSSSDSSRTWGCGSTSTDRSRTPQRLERLDGDHHDVPREGAERARELDRARETESVAAAATRRDGPVVDG